jgi:Na+-driven multidrug efflux pump
MRITSGSRLNRPISSEYLLIVSSFYIIFSGLFTINGVLRGAGDTLIPMFITLFALWLVRIPGAWFLSERIGETGIWWAVPIGWGSGTILSFLYYLTGRWKSKAVTKKRPELEDEAYTPRKVVNE